MVISYSYLGVSMYKSAWWKKTLTMNESTQPLVTHSSRNSLCVLGTSTGRSKILIHKT